MGETLNLLGNILWIILGGLETAIGWVVGGLILCITIIGIPFGLQCIKMAGFVVWPFGREVKRDQGSAGRFILNLLWVIIIGLVLAISHILIGIIYAITIIGIPFAKQHFKMVGIAFAPFGTTIVDKK
ncbi:MAG: YccF domain-containing protein [Candidatus Heimdallarchaeota archaeon]|nr:YccF domain-containing protein [Candidatus Heimdallarchaeota archaeon]